MTIRLATKALICLNGTLLRLALILPIYRCLCAQGYLIALHSWHNDSNDAIQIHPTMLFGSVLVEPYIHSVCVELNPGVLELSADIGEVFRPKPLPLALKIPDGACRRMTTKPFG
ncbi:MAG: hypothetical protein V3R26_01720 [Hyphomicrobium sp.]